MHAHYDPSIIQAFANNLYDQAERIVRAYALGGGFAGALTGFVFGMGLGRRDNDMALGVAFVFGILGAVVGYKIGQERAFALRLQAQTALCQVQIERNTQK